MRLLNYAKIEKAATYVNDATIVAVEIGRDSREAKGEVNKELKQVIDKV